VSEEVFEGFELSRQQKRLWLQGEQDLFVAQCVVLLEGALDQAILRRALQMTTSQHEMLRTSFQQLPGMKFPVQVIAEDVPEVTYERGNKFDLKRAPLIRCNLRRLATDKHLLSITQPALCADGDALAQLVLSLSRCYEACVRGQEWLEKPVQHVDFSEWQHELSNAPESEQGKKYWRERVEAARAEADHKEFAPAVFRFRLDKDLTESFLLTAWQVLISRLTEQAEIVIGHFCNGRRITHLQGCLGPLGEFLPLPLRIDGAARFSELMRQVHEAADANRRHQEYFSGDLPSLPVQFEFSERPQPQMAGRVRFTVRKVYACTDRYKLKLSVVGRDAELHYDKTSYSREAAKRIVDQYRTLLKSAVRNPDSIVKNLEVLSENERRVTVFAWNKTASEYRRDVCLHQLFEEQASRTPERPAVIFRDQQLTFAQLNSRADNLAQRLRRQGVGPEARVALYMQRSLEMVVAVLAIWKAGGVYIPLDITQPQQRLQLTLDDAKPQLILNADYADQSRGSDPDLIRAFDPRHPCSNNLAYIIYTSGSTGTPKGVMVTHRSTVNLLTALQQAIYSTQPCPLRVSVNAQLSFDASVKQLLQLLFGHTLVIIPEEIRANGPELQEYLSAHHVDVFDCTPSQLQLLLPEPAPRLLLVGGESISAELWKRLAADTSRAYYNVYGPTECTVDATAAKVQGNTPHIGRPLANTRIYLVDKALQPVPLGVRGELCIAGECLARGYVEDAAQTASKFVPEPFSGVAGARMYRTGDLGRYLEDGRLEFLGRLDHQVKLRGVRIELAEIEAALRKHEAVRDAVVQLHEEKLSAYVAVERRYLPVIDGRARYQLPNGLAILHQNKNETDYLYQELFENRTYIKNGIELPDNACVVDAGANIGLFTLFVLEHCRDADVYAFEPIKPIFETLKTNVELYSKDVKLFPFGLSDFSTTASFTFYPHYSMMSGLSDYARPADDVDVVKTYLLNQQDPLWQHADEFLPERFVGQTYQAQLRTLSEVISSEKLDHIDLLKIDVQRAELDVLNGIEEHDWQKILQIVMELHDATGDASEGRLHKISALLERHGFSVIAEQDKALRGTDRYNLYARRNNKQSAARQTKKHTIVTPLASASEFRNALKQQLPEYMIPSAFVFVEKLPLTRNGKVDRAALAALDSDQAAAAYVAPQNQMEQTVARIWQEALRVERVGANDNFFELGGHSLLVAQVHNRLVSTLGREISMVEMFQYPTVSALAKRLSEVGPRTRSLQSVHERAARQKEAMDRQSAQNRAR